VPIDGPGPIAAISLGVGENASKLVPGDFESKLIAQLAQRFPALWLDRGAGGEEAARVTAAAAGQNVRFWEGSFAGFASVISQCDFYVGYDSGAQHAAAAAGTPLITVFAGAPSPRFRTRWAAAGPGPTLLLDADTQTPDQLLARIDQATK
ncbi:MAG TPA: glycosyltransferase family 9 protein, partial [Bryobacteraceae bacterium]|nr:glycosyltransferase family 9 protein [Bryobacteraceae bacterium]